MKVTTTILAAALLAGCGSKPDAAPDPSFDPVCEDEVSLAVISDLDAGMFTPVKGIAGYYLVKDNLKLFGSMISDGDHDYHFPKECRDGIRLRMGSALEGLEDQADTEARNAISKALGVDQ